MRTDLYRQWLELRQQWYANPRLRILAAVVIVIMLISGLQGLQQLQRQAKQEAYRQWQRLEDVRQLSQEGHWQGYAQHATQVLQQLQQQLWHADSEGQAQAKLRDTLQQALNRNGLQALRINITSLPSSEMSLLQVRADLSGDYLPTAWQNFIHELSVHQPKLIIEHDGINRINAKRNLYRLSLHGWFVIGEQP